MATITRASSYVRPPRNVASGSFSKNSMATGGERSGFYPPSIEGGNKPRPSRPSSGDVVGQCADILRGLSRAEQKQALDLLAFQLATDQSHEASRDKDLWSGAVYDAVARALGGGAGGLPGPMLFKRVLAAPEAWQYVEGFMGTSGFSRAQVTERQAVYSLLARLLAEHALELNGKFGYPITPKMLGNLTQHLPTLFEEAFPGYLAAGLGMVVVKSLGKGFHHDPEDD